MEMHSKLNVYTDGGSRGNPGPAAIGVVICSEDHHVLVEHKEFLGENTNNVAEYTAMIRALEIAKDFTKGEVACVSDSELLVKQLNGEYQVRAEHLKPLYEELLKLQENFSKVTFKHERRHHPQITHADRLVNEALDANA